MALKNLVATFALIVLTVAFSAQTEVNAQSGSRAPAIGGSGSRALPSVVTDFGNAGSGSRSAVPSSNFGGGEVISGGVVSGPIVSGSPVVSGSPIYSSGPVVSSGCGCSSPAPAPAPCGCSAPAPAPIISNPCGGGCGGCGMGCGGGGRLLQRGGAPTGVRLFNRGGALRGGGCGCN